MSLSLKQWRHAVEIVAIAAAGIWGFYVFIYEERIKPSTEPAVFVEAISGDVTKVNARYELARFHIRFRNPGTRTLDVAAEEYNIYGMAEKDGQTRQWFRRNQWNMTHLYGLIDQDLLHSEGTLRAGAAGGDPSRHILLKPGSESVSDIALVVPTERYVAVDLHWKVFMGTYPIRPPYRITVQTQRDGAITLAGNAPYDNGSYYLPLQP